MLSQFKSKLLATQMEDQITVSQLISRRNLSRVKDPKKVAAGKALAKKNKEARDALKKRIRRWMSIL